jgi:hypothetical protein
MPISGAVCWQRVSEPVKNPIVTAPIVGASTAEQVEENCRITEDSLHSFPDPQYRESHYQKVIQ